MPLASNYASSRGVTVKATQRLMSAIYHQTWTNPAAAANNAYQTTQAGPNTTTVTYYRSGYQPAGNTVFAGTLATGVPDFPRNVVIVVTHATAVVALSGTITGIDVYGKNISESWSVTAGTTSKTFTGAKAFTRVDTVTVTAAADASADSVVVGTGTVFGLDVRCSVASGVKELANGSVVTNGTVVATSTSASADPRGTYSPNTAPNGTNDYELWFITDDPELSAT